VIDPSPVDPNLPAARAQTPAHGVLAKLTGDVRDRDILRADAAVAGVRIELGVEARAVPASPTVAGRDGPVGPGALPASARIVTLPSPDRVDARELTASRVAVSGIDAEHAVHAVNLIEPSPSTPRRR
jgi:hypothetical protein